VLNAPIGMPILNDVATSLFSAGAFVMTAIEYLGESPTHASSDSPGVSQRGGCLPVSSSA
jgi:hypothetical protein